MGGGGTEQKCIINDSINNHSSNKNKNNNNKQQTTTKANWKLEGFLPARYNTTPCTRRYYLVHSTPRWFFSERSAESRPNLGPAWLLRHPDESGRPRRSNVVIEHIIVYQGIL